MKERIQDALKFAYNISPQTGGTVPTTKRKGFVLARTAINPSLYSNQGEFNLHNILMLLY